MLLKPNFNPTAYNHLHPLSRGLVALYPFWEGNGDRLQDLTLNKNHGDLVGPKWVGSERGFVLDFDGTNDYVTFGDLAIVDTALAGNFHINVWFNSSFSADTQMIVSKRIESGDQEGFHIMLRTTGLIRGSFDTGAGFLNLDQVSSAVNDGDWHMASFGREGSTVSLYVDGIFEASGTLSGSGASSEVLDIGRRNTWAAPNEDFFNGMIDDLRIYDRALSSEEVKQLFYNLYGIYEI